MMSGLCFYLQGSPADYEKAIQATKAAWDEWAEVYLLQSSRIALNITVEVDKI